MRAEQSDTATRSRFPLSETILFSQEHVSQKRTNVYRRKQNKKSRASDSHCGAYDDGCLQEKLLLIALMKEIARAFETSLNYHITLRYNSEDNHVQGK
jgi:hypothetical protein